MLEFHTFPCIPFSLWLICAAINLIEIDKPFVLGIWRRNFVCLPTHLSLICPILFFLSSTLNEYSLLLSLTLLYHWLHVGLIARYRRSSSWSLTFISLLIMLDDFTVVVQFNICTCSTWWAKSILIMKIIYVRKGVYKSIAVLQIV